MSRVLNTFLPLVFLIGLIVVFRTPLFVFSYQAMRMVVPCTFAVPYRIDTIDARFDVSKNDIALAAREAIDVWEKAAGRDLFKEIATGTPVISVNLEYDLRQETTETLKDLGSQISDTSATYEEIEVQYDAKRAVFAQKKGAFQAAAAQFERDAAAYQKEVDSWNHKGGAPASVVNRLNSTKADLQRRQGEISANQQTVNALADEVNTLARRLNSIAGDINATAKTYNKVGAQTGEEFEEGVYETRAGSETITVFEFDSHARLTRLLAHEFGHALGIDHVEGEDSIMYRLNQGSNIEPTEEDIVALQTACRLP